jgi:O-antigen/teichoic acid export membrane protein
MRKETTRNFMKLFSGTMIAQGMSLLLAPILSRMFAPDDFGLLALYLSIFSILSVVSTAKYEQAIMLPKIKRDAVDIVWLVLGISFIVSLSTLAVTLLFSRHIANLAGNPAIAPWLVFLSLSLLLHGIHQATTFFANRDKLFGLMARATIAQYSVLNSVRIFAGWIHLAFNGLITGQLASQLAAAAFMGAGTWKPLARLLKGSTIEGIRKQARTYSGYPRFNMPLNFTNNLSGSLPVFLLTWGFSPAIAGLYAFGFNFVFRPISLFSQSAMQVLSQKIIADHHLEKHVYPTLKKLVFRLLLLIIIPILVLAAGAPRIFGLVFSDEYRMAGTLLQYLSPYLLMVFITSPLSFIPELYFRQKKAMIIDIIYLVIRAASLGAGIAAGSLTLAMVLFSAMSTLVVGYNLFWYLSLARKNDHTIIARL